MNEYEMACEVRKRIEQFGKIIDGVYVFNMGGKFGTVKNYQQDEEHWEVLFDNLTHEQVIELFEGAGTCHIVKTWTDSDYAEHWRYSCSECGYPIEVGERDIATGDPVSHANFCWNCGRKVADE